jgi:dipeptidyl aminopeptidase/acylaminoacyl peptidase
MVQAVCASATPTNFLAPMSDRARQRAASESNGNGDASRPTQLSKEIKAKISPITYVSADAPSFLLVHEASDRTVGVYQSDQFVEALKKAGATDVTYMRYEDGTGHGTFMANQQETKPAMKKFFDRVLK